MAAWHEILNLSPHPEGGWFREIFRSNNLVQDNSRIGRSALTHIYFELPLGDRSLFHKVTSDEIWNLYDGDELLIVIYDEIKASFEEIRLGKRHKQFCFVVQAGLWQAAKSIGGNALCGCSVAPGFEFEDFELIGRNTELAKIFSANGYKEFI